MISTNTLGLIIGGLMAYSIYASLRLSKQPDGLPQIAMGILAALAAIGVGVILDTVFP